MNLENSKLLTIKSVRKVLNTYDMPWQVAKVYWIYDPIFNKYYLKKKSENKHHFVILGHIEKKLVRVIYSILKNNTKYTSQ